MSVYIKRPVCIPALMSKKTISFGSVLLTFHKKKYGMRDGKQKTIDRICTWDKGEHKTGKHQAWNSITGSPFIKEDFPTRNMDNILR